MGSIRLSVVIAMLGLLMQAPVAVAADKAALPESPAQAPKTQPRGATLEQLNQAEKEDAELDRTSDTSLQDLPNVASHGVRERVSQQGVFMDELCAKARGEVPYCYCAANVNLPVFSRRVYTTSARSIQNNVWEYADELLDTAYCPPNYTKRRTEKPEDMKDKAGKAFFQRIEVPVFNKEYVSVVYDTFERDGNEKPLQIKFGALVDVKARRPMSLGQVLGSEQDAELSKFVNAELKKQDKRADAVKFAGGNSEDITSFYLSPQGVVLQFGPDSVSDEDRTLSVTLPASMIAQPSLRQLIQQPQG